MERAQGATISLLAQETLLQVFGYLTVPELAGVARVCQFWQSCARDDTLWRRLFFDRFGSFLPSDMSSKTGMKIAHNWTKRIANHDWSVIRLPDLHQTIIAADSLGDDYGFKILPLVFSMDNSFGSIICTSDSRVFYKDFSLDEPKLLFESDVSGLVGLRRSAADHVFMVTRAKQAELYEAGPTIATQIDRLLLDSSVTMPPRILNLSQGCFITLKWKDHLRFFKVNDKNKIDHSPVYTIRGIQGAIEKIVACKGKETTYIVVLTSDGKVQAFDLLDPAPMKKPLWTVLPKPPSGLFGRLRAALTAIPMPTSESDLLLSYDETGELAVISPSDGSVQCQLTAESNGKKLLAVKIAFSPLRVPYAVVVESSRIAVWSILERKIVWKTSPDSGLDVTQFSLLNGPNGSYLFVVFSGNGGDMSYRDRFSISIWRLFDHEQLKPVELRGLLDSADKKRVDGFYPRGLVLPVPSPLGYDVALVASLGVRRHLGQTSVFGLRVWNFHERNT